jgi:hypothetical protein
MRPPIVGLPIAPANIAMKETFTRKEDLSQDSGNVFASASSVDVVIPTRCLPHRPLENPDSNKE